MAMSTLGAEEGWVYFNTGFIISGYIGALMCYERYKDFNKLLMIIGIITMVLLSFIGWFPIPYEEHGFFAIILFIFVGIFFSVYSILAKNFIAIIIIGSFLITLLICIPLSEWIMFIEVNTWIIFTSLKDEKL